MKQLLQIFLFLFLSVSAYAQTTCTYTLNMFDSFGDGWNGAQLTVVLNGTPTVYTVTDVDNNGESNTVEIMITEGDTIGFIYAPGAYENEVTYQLVNPEDGIVFSDGPQPAVGAVFTSILSCSCFGLDGNTVSIDDIRATYVDVSWGETSTDDTYILEVGPTEFGLGTGVVYDAGDAEAFRIGQLEEHTNYEFYIANICENGDTSAFSGPFSFMTRWKTDLGIVGITSPRSGCGLMFDSITVQIQNFGGVPQTFIPFNYSVNGIPQNVPMPNDGFFTGVIGTDSIETVPFETTFDFSEPGDYIIQAWTDMEGDSMRSNDTITYVVTSVETLGADNLPYLATFETGSEGWTVGDGSVNPSWELGEPNNTLLNMAGAGEASWVTNLTGEYNVSEVSYLMSPCMDFSEMTEDPTIRFLLFMDTESCCDEAWLEVTTDGEETWQKVGASGTGSNWYNDEFSQWWNGTGGFTGWVTAQNTLAGTAGEEEVRLRFVFSSDFSVQNEGMGIDNIAIFAPLAVDLGPENAAFTGESPCGDTATVVSVDITNFGTQAQSDFDVSYVVNGGTPVTETVAQTLGAGETITYTFNTTVNAGSLGTYEILIYSDALNDGFLANDTTSITVSTANELPLVETFESGALPDGWTSDEINPVFGPNSHNNTTGIVGANNYSGNPDFELVTSVYGALGAADTLRFEYRYTVWSAGTEGIELNEENKLTVEISTDCGENYELIYELTGDNHEPTAEFTEVAVGLDNYEGEYIQLRFRNEWGVGDYWIDMDNINIATCPESMELEVAINDATGDMNMDGSATITPNAGFGPFTYEWSNDSTGETVTGLEPGQYQVSVTDALGCTDMIAFEVSVNSVDEPGILSELTLAPNPTSGYINLHAALDEPQVLNIQVFSLVGQLIERHQTDRVSDVDVALDLSEQPAGIYLVRVVAGDHAVTRRVILSK